MNTPDDFIYEEGKSSKRNSRSCSSSCEVKKLQERIEHLECTMLTVANICDEAEKYTIASLLRLGVKNGK